MVFKLDFSHTYLVLKLDSGGVLLLFMDAIDIFPKNLTGKRIEEAALDPENGPVQCESTVPTSEVACILKRNLY